MSLIGRRIRSRLARIATTKNSSSLRICWTSQWRVWEQTPAFHNTMTLISAIFLKMILGRCSRKLASRMAKHVLITHVSIDMVGIRNKTSLGTISTIGRAKICSNNSRPQEVNRSASERIKQVAASKTRMIALFLMSNATRMNTEWGTLATISSAIWSRWTMTARVSAYLA